MTQNYIGSPGTQGGIGFWGGDEGEMLLDTALMCAAGDMLMLKETAVNATTGVPDTVLVPTTAGLVSGIFCVALQAQATAAGPVRVRYRGRVPALIVGTDAIGTRMMGTNAARGLSAATGGNKVCAIMYEVGVAAATKQVYFNGIEGLHSLT